MKKILIVEDDNTISNELKELLINSGYKAEVLEDFQNSKEKILESQADLILLDINIPGINGEILLKEIRKVSDVPIIMVTSRTSEVDEVLTMSYGADDFITKPYSPTVLLLRIQNIFKRMEPKSDRIRYKDLEINIGKGSISNGSKEINLTKNEMIIFSYLLNNREKIVTRDELMTDLWNNEEYINDNALTVNISRLRNKLSEVGLNKAVGEVLIKNRDDLLENKINIQVDLNNYSVFTDSKWFQFILNQIINNSIKYKKAGVESIIKITASQTKDETTIEIFDNGIGIPRKDLKKVFNKSFTGENGRIGAKSTGMGLYIADRLCKKLGHRIEIESEQNVDGTSDSYTKVKIVFGRNDYLTLQNCNVK